jgi:hypothetical protein
VLTKARPIDHTEQLPLVFRGGQSIADISIASVGNPGRPPSEVIESMYAKDSLAGAVSESFNVRDEPGAACIIMQRYASQTDIQEF